MLTRGRTFTAQNTRSLVEDANVDNRVDMQSSPYQDIPSSRADIGQQASQHARSREGMLDMARRPHESGVLSLVNAS
jgi:hypothetical protein